MPVPTSAPPPYEMVTPSTKHKSNNRPFLVKEEKVLILAMESEDTKQIASAVKDVIKNCIITRGVKVEELSTFDIEYLFLNIRGKSVGEEVEVLITCPDDGTTKVPTVIDLDSIQVQYDEEHSRDIKLDDSLTLRMRYPSMNEFIQNNFVVSDVNLDNTFDIITSCIEQIYSEEESWSSADCIEKELKEFIEQLNSKQFKEVETFFSTMPKLSHKLVVTNPNTGVDNEIILEGLASFFG